VSSPSTIAAGRIRTPEECAQAQLDAYNTGDITTFAAVYADDVQLMDLSTGVVFCSGRPALIERYGTLFQRNPSLHCTLLSRIVAPPFVIDEEHVVGLAEQPVHAVATYEVHGGEIQRAWFLREQPSA